MQPNQTKTPNTRVASIDLAIFVKLAYLLIGGAALAYFWVQTSHGGSLAAAAENASLGLMYAVGGLTILFGIGVVGTSLRK